MEHETGRGILEVACRCNAERKNAGIGLCQATRTDSKLSVLLAGQIESGGYGATTFAKVPPHTPDLRAQPADLRERLGAAYPGADVDELLAKSSLPL